MNNRLVATIFAVVLIGLGLMLTIHGVRKNKWSAKRVMYCVGGFGCIAVGGYCAVGAKGR